MLAWRTSYQEGLYLLKPSSPTLRGPSNRSVVGLWNSIDLWNIHVCGEAILTRDGKPPAITSVHGPQKFSTSHHFFFGGRTFLSSQIKRACNITVLRHISVEMSPSTSMEVVELVVRLLILGHPFRHIDILSCFLVLGQRRIWCSRRNCGQQMKSHGASWTVLLSGGGIKSEQKECGANEGGSNRKSIKYVHRATTLS